MPKNPNPSFTLLCCGNKTPKKNENKEDTYIMCASLDVPMFCDDDGLVVITIQTLV
jgi:hypothetical protein